MFEMDFFEVGNPLYIGLEEELMEEQVLDAVDYIRSHYPDGHLRVEDMDAVIAAFDIDYPQLPKWLQDKFDEFDVY